MKETKSLLEKGKSLHNEIWSQGYTCSCSFTTSYITLQVRKTAATNEDSELRSQAILHPPKMLRCHNPTPTASWGR